MKKPYHNFFSAKFYDYRKTDEYKKGVRTIFSIQYEQPCASLLSPTEKWLAPIANFKIVCGWILINGFILWGKVTLTGYENDEDSCNF